MRTLANVKKDLKTVREPVIGAKDKNDAGNGLDEEDSATTDEEDVKMRESPHLRGTDCTRAFG